MGKRELFKDGWYQCVGAELVECCDDGFAAAGARIGWKATPNLLAYFAGGYTEAAFDQLDLNFYFTSQQGGAPAGSFVDGRTYRGFFVGAGDEQKLDILQGLFLKNEYRFSQFGTETNTFQNFAPAGSFENSRKWTHTVRSELVYRFDWDNPAAAKH